MADESSLILRAKSGDLPALEQLFVLHSPALLRLAANILGSRDDAEDALQEVMVKVLRHPNRLDPRRPLRPFLWRVMTNECLSRLRRRRRESIALEQIAAPPTCPDDGPAAAVIHEVRQAMTQLPPGQRIAITLVGLEGLDLRGAAQVMGCSLGTLKSHLHRAREKLKAQLADHLPPEGREP